jgi:hypothetical protein
VPDAALRHPHLADALPPGRLRVDMHTHTMWSGDSTTTPDEVLAAVVASGIDVLCVTDHHAIAGARQLVDVLPCQVVVGEEIRSSAGEIIGLFLTERVPNGMSPRATAEAIRSQGGIVYVPHPFDPMRRNLTEAALIELTEASLVDAIEALNAKTSLASLNARARAFGVQHGLALGAGSDAHVPDAIGAAVVEVDDFASAPEFLDVLRAGGVVRGHHWDQARPWSPRVIPSLG